MSNPLLLTREQALTSQVIVIFVKHIRAWFSKFHYHKRAYVCVALNWLIYNICAYMFIYMAR